MSVFVCVCGGGYVCGIFNSAKTAAAGDSRCEQVAPQRCKYSLLFFSSFCCYLSNEYFPEFIAAEATCVRACQCARAQPASQNLSSAISLEYAQTPTPSQMVRNDVVGLFGGYFVFLFFSFALLRLPPTEVWRMWISLSENKKKKEKEMSSTHWEVLLNLLLL